MGKLMVWVVFFCVLPFASHAELMRQSTSLTIDFTKPDEAATKVIWTDSQTVQTVPVGVGWSWLTVSEVTVHLEVLLREEGKIRENTTTHFTEKLFARFSPDQKHWSAWQALTQDQPPVGSERSKHAYHANLRIPESDSARYLDLLDEYRVRNVPWASDEEAAVKWILERQPGFFEKNIPFIGYVQFKGEVGSRGKQLIKQLQFDLFYYGGGRHIPPKDPKEYERRKGPWRFQAK